MTEMNKSSRHSDITGRFGENLILYWLSKHGFETCNVNHTGIDIIANNPHTKEVMGISVKSRSRYEGTEGHEINITPNDLEYMDKACEAFNCIPYFAFIVDSIADKKIRAYILSKEKFLELWPMKETYCGWKMSGKHIQNYEKDADIIKIEFSYEIQSWWNPKPKRKSSLKSLTSVSILFISLLFTSCSTKIGNLTIVSTRNIDSKTEYVELKRYNKAKGKTIESAIEKCLREVRGGEFIKNCKIYRRIGGRYKIEGDVWGTTQTN